VAAVHATTLVNMRLLLATYDWKTFYQHLQLYQEFGGLVHGFPDYVVCLVVSIAAGGVSRQTYYKQKHLIFPNMCDDVIDDILQTETKI